MEATRPMQRAAQGLGACFAALWLVSQPVAAETAHAAKTDRLVLQPTKSDLLDHRPGRAEPAGPAVLDDSAFASRGSAARKLIDVAVRDGEIWINSFATRSMPLDALDCAVLSDEIVERLPLPASAVQRLAEEELMRQTRVCAANGNLLVTCYGGAATVSLRRPQHGDGCSD